MDIKIDDEFKNLIPPLSKEEYDRLEKNLLEETNSNLITLITWNGTLVDGHHRYEICQKHNIKFQTIEKQFQDKNDAKLWIINNQLGRRNLNNYVRGKLGLKLDEIISEMAKANLKTNIGNMDLTKELSKEPYQKSDKPFETVTNPEVPEVPEKPYYYGFGNYGFDYSKGINKLDNIKNESEEPIIQDDNTKIKPIHTNKELGKIVKLSHDTIAKIKIIEERATDDIKKELEEDKKSINEVYNKIINEEKEKIRKEEHKQKNLTPQSLPDEKFDIILADPPWRYDFSATDSRKIENQYPTMEVDDICKIPVPTAENSVLFLWATMPKLIEALKVMESWGFKYKTGAVWDKQKIGMGYYFRGQHELLLLGTKGKPQTPLPENVPSSVISVPRSEHSVKPDEVYEIIEKMYPAGKYLEMFARNKRDKWEHWGNEL